MADTRKVVFVAAGSLAATGAILALVFSLAGWAYRHRGVATALIAHCVDDARAHGAGPVVIVSDPTDTPKHMYAALGFRPVALKRGWLKRLGD